MSKKHGFPDNLLKKRLIIPIAVAFFVFVIIGFWAASRLGSPLIDRILPKTLSETQKNYLLIQVNDLEKRSPDVVAIWVAFIDHSDSTHLVFMPLFPNPDPKINIRIARSLKVTRDGLLADRTISKIESRYNIRTNGVVAIDNAGLISFTQDLFDESLTPVLDTPKEEEDILRSLAAGKDLFSSFCAGILQQDDVNILNKINWGELLPSHFATSLAFEELTLELESLKTAGQIQTCEIIEN